MTVYKCGSAESCQFGEMCKPKYDIGGCSHFKQKKPQTNEEWRKTCSAEEFAEWIATQCGNAVMESTYDVSQLRKKRYWVEWLKQPHTTKE